MVKPDSRPGFYYVSIIRGTRVGLLAGPFINDHSGALAWVDRARAAAEEHDPRAVFDAFGTVRMTDYAKPGVLNAILGLPAELLLATESRPKVEAAPMSDATTKARADLLTQLDRSGIPQAVKHARQRDEVVSEFSGNPQAMADAILQLRAELALAGIAAAPPPVGSTRHTTGTWHRNIPPARKYVIIFAGRNTHVCRLCTEGLTDEEIEGNADLIAAAPDMLEALHAAVRLLRAAGYAMEGTATARIQAAITKACGGAT